MIFEDKNIVIVSPENWGDLHLSKHLYAQELSKRNNVVFLSFSRQNKLLKLDSRLQIFHFKPRIRGVNKLPVIFQKLFQRNLIRKVRRLFKNKKVDVIWTFDPYVCLFQKLWQAECSIYHAVDVHYSKYESRIINDSDFVFASSNLILERLKTLGKGKFKFINHGVSNLLFNSTEYYSENIDSEKINIGWIGNLNHSFIDVRHLKEVVLDNPNVVFHFVGPLGSSNLSEKTDVSIDVESIIELENVVHHGVIKKDAISGFIKRMHMMWICYDDVPMRIANPHKILEFLSLGKPVVSGPLDQYKDRGDLIVMSDKIEGLPVKFKECLSNLNELSKDTYCQRRISFAKENTYDKQVKRIEAFIQQQKEIFE